MAQKKGYDVLRFTTHGKGSYISTTYVEGVTLFQWISETPKMKKSDCFVMIREITKQLELFHKSKGDPIYQYVNPYCIVLSEDKKIYLMDMKAESNAERLRKMQSRKIRERFLPISDPFYQNTDIQTDLFGFGRTLQYMMAAVELEMPLTRREEKQIKNVIGRCLGKKPKKRYENIAAVRKHLPQIKDDQEERAYAVRDGGKRWKHRILLSICLILCVLAGIFGKSYMKKSHTEAGGGGRISAGQRLWEETMISTMKVEPLEISENRERGQAEKTDDAEEQKDEKSPEDEGDQAEDTETFEKLSKAQSLETLGRYLEAADLYEEILISLDNIQEKERLYEKSASLYMKLGNYDKAYEVMEFGMSELLPSDYLWSSYLDLLTNNDEISDRQKVNYVSQFMENNEEYEKKKYQKLLQDTDFYKNDKDEENKSVDVESEMEETEANTEKVGIDIEENGENILNK